MRGPADCDPTVHIRTVDDVLTAEECAELVARVDDANWMPTARINDDAPLITSGPDASDAGRDQEALADMVDPLLALRLYHRLADQLPGQLDERELFGLKPHMHCLRYLTGHSSVLHRDRPYAGESHERSELTLLVYLNDDFEGGQTEFPGLHQRIVPRAGRAVLFPHGMLHRGSRVADGTKYVLRTEVYYAPPSGRR